MSVNMIAASFLRPSSKRNFQLDPISFRIKHLAEIATFSVFQSVRNSNVYGTGWYSSGMNTLEIQEYFEYLIESRARFLQTFRGIGWAAFSQDRGATWGSMLGIFLHILDDEEGWLQYGAKKGTLAGSPDRKISDYHDFDQLEADNAKVGALSREYLSTLTGEDLDREILLHLSDGVYSRKISKILTHAAVDEIAHIGEWICLLWQIGVRPPYIDWLDFRV
jgi:uncharacterized damage-inducible protein DinB